MLKNSNFMLGCVNVKDDMISGISMGRYDI